MHSYIKLEKFWEILVPKVLVDIKRKSISKSHAKTGVLLSCKIAYVLERFWTNRRQYANVPAWASFHLSALQFSKFTLTNVSTSEMAR